MSKTALMALLATTEEGRIYGPYLSTTIGRRVVVIQRPDGTKTSTTYARWLLEQKLGKLPPGLDADHVDEDPLNDDLANLRPLEVSKNRSRSARPLEMIEFVCPVCSSPSSKPASKVRHNRKQGKAGPFCSKSCAGRHKGA